MLGNEPVVGFKSTSSCSTILKTYQRLFEIFELNKQLKNPNTLKELIIYIVNCEKNNTNYDFTDKKNLIIRKYNTFERHSMKELMNNSNLI